MPVTVTQPSKVQSLSIRTWRIPLRPQQEYLDWSHTTATPVERNVIDVHIHTPKIKIQATQLARQNANPIITTELCPPPNMNLKDLLQATWPQKPLSASSSQLGSSPKSTQALMNPSTKSMEHWYGYSSLIVTGTDLQHQCFQVKPIPVHMLICNNQFSYCFGILNTLHLKRGSLHNLLWRAHLFPPKFSYLIFLNRYHETIFH